MLAQVSRNQQAGNVEGLQSQHPLRRIHRIVVVAEPHIRAREVSTNGCIVGSLLFQVPGLIPGTSEVTLVKQEGHMRFAQLKILRGETEASGDGLCCLAIVIGRRGLVRPADESQSKTVVALGAFGIDCDLLPGGCDSLLRGGDLMDLSPGLEEQNRR